MDERAAFHTPGDTPACSSIGPDGFVCTQEPGHWGDHEAWGWSGLMKAWPSRPDAVRDGRHLFENDRNTLDPSYQGGDLPSAGRVIAEEHDGRIDPVAKRDLTLMLIALLRLRDYSTPAARRRAYRRIPKQWGRAIRREMAGLIEALRRVRAA
jgi:hypothetical protein